MPKEIKKRQTWSTSSLQAACQAVLKKEMGTLKASKQFGIPRSTIREYIKKDVNEKNDGTAEVRTVVRKKLGRKPKLFQSR